MERIIVKSIFWISVLSFVIWAGVRIDKDYDLDAEGAGHFFRAYKANTVSSALDEWNKGIAFLERENLTEGNTGAFWQTPSDDLEFFYQNVLEMRDFLKTLPDTLSLESFDQKVISNEGNPVRDLSFTVFDRKALLERMEATVKNSPGGMSIYPHNYSYAIWCWISILLFIITGIWWLARSYEWD